MIFTDDELRQAMPKIIIKEKWINLVKNYRKIIINNKIIREI